MCHRQSVGLSICVWRYSIECVRVCVCVGERNRKGVEAARALGMHLVSVCGGNTKYQLWKALQPLSKWSSEASPCSAAWLRGARGPDSRPPLGQTSTSRFNPNLTTSSCYRRRDRCKRNKSMISYEGDFNPSVMACMCGASVSRSPSVSASPYPVARIPLL